MRKSYALLVPLAVVAMMATTAGAASIQRVTGTMSNATATNLGQDGFCPQNPYFASEGEEPHTRIAATIDRDGPDLAFQLDACWVDTGSLGGRTFEGSFSVTGHEGTATGSVTFGSQPAAPHSPLAAQLLIDEGTHAYRNTLHGVELFFEACSDAVLFFEGPGSFSLSPALFATAFPSPSLPCNEP